jgi:hypothetical protein
MYPCHEIGNATPVVTMVTTAAFQYVNQPQRNCDRYLDNLASTAETNVAQRTA